MSRCKRPCRECPYQKGSMRGEFGGNNPMMYRHAINGESVIPCHMKSKHGADGEVTKAVPCVGLVLSMRKSCKLPMSERLRGLIEETKQLPDEKELVSNSIASWEFEEYHRL